MTESNKYDDFKDTIEQFVSIIIWLLFFIIIILFPLVFIGSSGLLIYDGVNSYYSIHMDGYIEQSGNNTVINIDEKSDNFNKIILSNNQKNITYDINKNNTITIKNINNTGEYDIYVRNKINNKMITTINTDDKLDNIIFKSGEEKQDSLIPQILFSIIFAYFGFYIIIYYIKFYDIIFNAIIKQ